MINISIPVTEDNVQVIIPVTEETIKISIELVNNNHIHSNYVILEGITASFTLEAQDIIDSSVIHMADTDIHLSVEEVIAINNSILHIANTDLHLSVGQVIDIASSVTHIANETLHLSTEQITDIDNSVLHIADTDIHLSTGQVTDISNSVAHIADTDIHVTANQSAALDGSTYELTALNPVVDHQQFTEVVSDITDALTTQETNLTDHIDDSDVHFVDTEKADLAANTLVRNYAEIVRFSVVNNTAAMIPKGTIVYPDETTGIDIADASIKRKSRIIAMAENDLAVGVAGYVVKLGAVTGLNTLGFNIGQIVHLGWDATAGQYVADFPDDGGYHIGIGVVEVIGETDGEIFIDIATSDLTVEITDQNGFPYDLLSDSELSFTDGTRTFYITPTGDSFHYYQLGDKYFIESVDSIIIPDETGLYAIYYDSGSLEYIKNPNDYEVTIVIRKKVTVAYVYYNATSGGAVLVNDERHGISMSPDTHAYLHFTRGAQYANGFAPESIVIGNGSLDSHVQFGISSGAILDEDLYHALDAVTSTTGLAYFYRLSTGDWYKGTNTGFSFPVGATPLPQYNQWTGTEFQLTELISGNYMLLHIFACPDIDKKPSVILGITDYNSIAGATAGLADEVNQVLAGLAAPEYVPIASFILEGKTSFTNSVNARIVQNSDGEDYRDWRVTEVSQGAGASSHNNLANLNLAGLGVTWGHISDQVQTIEGKKTFTDGIESSDIEVSAIDQLVASVDAVAVCYHKVAWDDDPDWIEKCEGTSWYNETLNTATRGATRKFPAEVLIVAESAKVTLYDATNTSLPMWMVFDIGAYRYIRETPKAVSFRNGQLITGGLANGISIADFVLDSNPACIWRSVAPIYYITLPVSGRNNTNSSYITTKTAEYIINYNVNDIALTLLPDAPINPATGMRYPTIAVATDGGVSIIDGPAGVGTVVDIVNTNATYTISDKVAFRVNGTFCYCMDNGTSSRMLHVMHILPSTDKSGDITWGAASWDDEYYSSDAGDIPLLSPRFVDGIAGNYFAGSEGLNKLYPNPSTPTEGAIAYITKDYNTGLMRGDIQLATLADTEAGSVGGELVTNGDFATDTDWTKGTGWIIGSGVASSDASAQSETETLRQDLNISVGRFYAVSFTVSNYLTGTLRVYFGNLMIQQVSVDGTYSFIIENTATSSTDVFYFSSVAGAFTGSIDNVSVTEAIPDRCVQENHAEVIGSLIKTAVATGAELVRYSGFGTSNYAVVPYSSDFDFSTGDFCISSWSLEITDSTHFLYGLAKAGAGWTGNTLVLRYDYTANCIRILVAGNIITTNYDPIGKGLIKLDTVRRSGILYLYANGMEVFSVANTVDLSLTTEVFYIGLGHYDNIFSHCLSDLALIKISKTAPSVEQIKADYLTELPMFQENTKCTLSGSSDSVLALDYDKQTENVTVLTDVVDVFNGLINVKQSTLTGTGQCVSVGDGTTLIGTSSQVTFEKPAINLREELIQASVRVKQFGFVPQQLRCTGDTTETDFDIPSGYSVWAVYGTDGTLKLEGATDDYEVENNGNNKTVVFAAAPSALDFVIFIIPTEVN